MAPLTRPNETDYLAVDDNLGQYRAVSGLAVAGLLTGLFSILAFVHYLLYGVPLASIVINLLALRRIAEASPALIGRKAALTGLALALIFLIAAPVQEAVYDRDLHVQSLQVAEEWFRSLREDRPELAYRLTQFPTSAAMRQQDAVKNYRGVMVLSERLQKYLRESPIELLLKLGKRAHVRFCANQDIWSEREMEGVRDYFVVTVGKGPQAVSFFISLGLTRTKDVGTGEILWQITKAEFVDMPTPELRDALGG
ncbi:MAG TPA: hypothetical protein VG125_32130 [Pirellulales bacterium]|jgi:hypothetical protein|nr:hypothetical protein [Pirellulales bacterium]